MLSPSTSSPHSFTSLLVTGEMRSGTTLVANFLNSQSGCTVYADLLKGWFGEPGRLALSGLSAELSQRQKNVLLSSLVAAGWQFGISAFEQIKSENFSNWYDLFETSLRCLDPDRKSSVIGVKITQQYEMLDELMTLGTKVVFCVRDPRDVAVSAKNRFSNYNLNDTVLSWRNSLQQMQGYIKNPNFYFLQFETLFEKGSREKTVGQLADFLGVPLEPDTKTLKIRNGVDFVSNTSFGDVKEVFDKKALFRWKRDLTSEEVIFISGFLKKELVGLDYEIPDYSQKDYAELLRKFRSYRLKVRVRDSLLNIYRNLLK